MLGYFLIVGGAALVAAGVRAVQGEGSKGWDKFRLDKLEGGRIPPLLEDKIREIATAEARAEAAAGKLREIAKAFDPPAPLVGGDGKPIEGIIAGPKKT